ncbi:MULTISPECIES: HNH endonuclease [Psychrilyobacter]|uniref:HNH endonuclease n=1 Tax=Psychrilyobacter TaxID=623282 RepID=UPI001314A928|nr:MULTISPECIES: HNH endonuclease signature motif containing protein [Psychrilyobacter]MCS5422167.1 HNH endonuclease [Psychrilyobacter sp. S5]NDI78510.1 HNH endonuclease [Psychrilyobacter piezotolerans]
MIYNRLKDIARRNHKDERYRERFRGYNYKTWSINNTTLFTIQARKWKLAKLSSKKKPKKLTIKQDKSKRLIDEKTSHKNNQAYSKEWSAIRAILYHRENCICYVTGEYVRHNEFVVHHIIPKEYGGKDNFENLIILKKEIHIELHKKNPSFSNPKFDELRKEILNCK